MFGNTRIVRGAIPWSIKRKWRPGEADVCVDRSAGVVQPVHSARARYILRNNSLHMQ